MKKRSLHMLALALGLTMALAPALAGCNLPETPPESGKHTHTYSEDWQYDDTNHWHVATCEHSDLTSDKAAHTFTKGDKCDVCDYERPFTVSYRSGYTPEKFSGVTHEVTKLADGVHLVKNTMTLSKDDKISVVYTIEIDLSQAGIAAGTKDNATTDFKFVKTTPYAMAQAWEKATGGQVYASINADFFGDYCVNAFVKDGVIVKDGHNDNGNYDYTFMGTDKPYVPGSDVPASAPMLFGVKGDTAQIAPIKTVAGDPTDPSVKEQWVKAKLSYSLVFGGKTYSVVENGKVGSDHITYYTQSTDLSIPSRSIAVKVQNTQGTTFKVLEVLQGRNLTCEAEAGTAWLCASSTNEAAEYLGYLKKDDELTFSVASPDGAWNGFDTILGCRHALVIDGEVASTVTLENSNGAQDRDIPRTAVGLKPDGTVVLFAVESLWYGKSKTEDVRVDSDTHGLNLPELAEFAYYYGCTVAANFDGGGSTQLTVRGEGEESPRVLVRSSDTGLADVTKTRPVMNGFLITSKKA